MTYANRIKDRIAKRDRPDRLYCLIMDIPDSYPASLLADAFDDPDSVCPIKIGITKDLERRIKSHRCSSPFPLRRVCDVPFSVRAEKTLHRLLEDHLMSTVVDTPSVEWYRPTLTVRWVVHLLRSEFVSNLNVAPTSDEIASLVARAASFDYPPPSLLTDLEDHTT